MSKYLITHSLLSSWLYAIKENPYEDATTERNSYDEFLMALRREPTPTTEAMQKGTDFENLVTDIVNGGGNQDHHWYGAACTVANIVQGGPLQVKVTKEITVGGISILLHGRLDSLKAGVIRDIKFSSSYDRGKYITSTQHPTYFELVPEAEIFEYIISNGTDVWTESYSRSETPGIIPTIADFLSWLQAMDLMSLYQEKWLARNQEAKK